MKWQLPWTDVILIFNSYFEGFLKETVWFRQMLQYYLGTRIAEIKTKGILNVWKSANVQFQKRKKQLYLRNVDITLLHLIFLKWCRSTLSNNSLRTISSKTLYIHLPNSQHSVSFQIPLHTYWPYSSQIYATVY